MKSKEVIPQEDGTITDHELNRVLGRYLGDNPIAGKATIFAYAFRLGQQFASKPPAQGESAEEILDKHYNKNLGFLSITWEQVIAAMHEYRNQPQAHPLWEEVPVSELKPEDVIQDDIPKDFLLFEDGVFLGSGFWAPITEFWVINSRKAYPTHYLRPVTRTTVQGDGFSEEDMEKAFDEGAKSVRQLYESSGKYLLHGTDVTTNKKQFIQSIKNK